MSSSERSNILALIFYNFRPSLPVMSTKKQKLASSPEFMLYGSVWDHIISYYNYFCSVLSSFLWLMRIFC